MPPPEQTGSLYGQTMLDFVADFRRYAASAYETGLYVATHGYRYPIDLAVGAFGFFDRAAFKVLRNCPELPIAEAALPNDSVPSLVMYINSLGRLHIRSAEQEKVRYSVDDKIITIGFVCLSATGWSNLHRELARTLALEEYFFNKVKGAMDSIHNSGCLPEVLEEVADHVEHVESVCFYVGDRFLARIDRFVNLIAGKGFPGFLTELRDKPYARWTNDEILTVAALHALFLSGRAVRFEEFNGAALTATALWRRLSELLNEYRQVGCTFEDPVEPDLFELARLVREQSLKSMSGDWLRYRRIYGLNFHKREGVTPTTISSENAFAHLAEFSDEYKEIVGRAPTAEMEAPQFFRGLAQACVDRDCRAIACDRGSDATSSWTEWLIERIVVSAIRASNADYGMSSSIRNMSALMESEEGKLLDVIHGLQTGDFYTCFVSRGFREKLDKKVADMIAESVQRRMMFNRWHFIPGNIKRNYIQKKRHWYYPPLIADIAIHSDIHRAGHARAQVKFSIRAPGPDLSRPPLVIANHSYRGFYDVRVVRMQGCEFTIDDLLRTRRRCLWLESLYAVVSDFLQSNRHLRLPVTGFKPGVYLDLHTDNINLWIPYEPRQ